MAIVGLGLIGGSLALAARARGLVGEVVGVGRGRANLEAGLACGAADRVEQDLAAGVTGADLVVLAVPVAAMEPIARRLAEILAPGVIVTDVGSVKRSVVRPVEEALGTRARFVGGHPIAGTERSGVAHSFPELFEGRRCILTPTERTDGDALARVRALWEGVGMEVAEMDPDRHDSVLAMVSHLPHLVAFALLLAVDEREAAGEDCLSFSAGGLADFTRVAGSDPVMWRDIFLANTDQVLAALDRYRAELDRLAGWMREGRGDDIAGALARSRELRSRLEELRGARRDDG